MPGAVRGDVMTEPAFDTAEWREQTNREIVTRRCPICWSRGALLIVRGFAATGRSSYRLETRCACLGCGARWAVTRQ